MSPRSRLKGDRCPDEAREPAWLPTGPEWLEHLGQERRVRSCCGLVSTSRGSPASTTTPSSMKTRVSPTSRAKPISWVTTTIVMPLSARPRMTSRTSPTSSGSSARGRLVEEHQLGLHRQRAGDRHPLLLAAGELGRVGVDLCRPGRPARAARAPRSRQLVLAARPSPGSGASMTFSSAVMCGNRLNRWNTMPMSRRCAATSLSASSCSLPPFSR